MLSLNKVILAGNLTRDPEVKFLANERAVANFGLAVNERWKDKNGETKENTTFLDIEAWGRTAELVGQYLFKGHPCYIEGKLKLDTWEKDGVKQYKLKVIADTVQFLGAVQKAGGGSVVDGYPKSSAPKNPTDHAPKQVVPSSSGGVGFDEPPF